MDDVDKAIVLTGGPGLCRGYRGIVDSGAGKINADGKGLKLVIDLIHRS